MNPKAIVQQLQDMGCKFLGIYTIDDDLIVGQNPAKNNTAAQIKAQADKIVKYLDKAPNGTYVIFGKTSPQAKPTKFIYTKGEESPTTAAAPTSAPSRGLADPGSESVLSYSQALKMQEQIAELRAENARLSDLVASLQADIADLEEVAEESQMAAQPESPAMGALGQLAAVLPAIVDKWFEQQKEKNEIEKAKLFQMAQRQNQYQPRQDESF